MITYTLTQPLTISPTNTKNGVQVIIRSFNKKVLSHVEVRSVSKVLSVPT